MKKWLVVSSLIVIGIVIALAAFYKLELSSTEIVFDAKNQHSLPARFRSVASLRILGSAQFSQAELRFLISFFQQPVIIVDLRQETHGFIDGNAVSWMKQVSGGFVPVLLSDNEYESSLRLARTMGITKIYEVEPYNDQLFHNQTVVPLPMVNSNTEEELANAYNLSYVNFPVNYIGAPSANTVDQFVKFIQSLPPNAWLYFHCRDGIKRTNVFMAMYDMMQNAKTTDFETIINRQYILTAKNSAPYDAEQLAFLNSFYTYCHNNTDNFQTTWSLYRR